jgi:hypothetical protein
MFTIYTPFCLLINIIIIIKLPCAAVIGPQISRCCVCGINILLLLFYFTSSEQWDTLHANLEHLEVEDCKSEKSARILRCSGISHIFQSTIFHFSVLQSCMQNVLTYTTPPGTVSTCVWRPGWNRPSHFARWFGALRSEILQIWKSIRFSRILGFWHFFQICNISLLCALKWHAKYLNFFQLAAVRICVRVPGRSVLIHFASQFGALRSRILHSEKCDRFLSISRFWQFFQICNIPLLSAPNWHAKCLNIFSPGTMRLRLGGGGGPQRDEGVGDWLFATTLEGPWN